MKILINKELFLEAFNDLKIMLSEKFKTKEEPTKKSKKRKKIPNKKSNKTFYQKCKFLEKITIAKNIAIFIHQILLTFILFVDNYQKIINFVSKIIKDFDNSPSKYATI